MSAAVQALEGFRARAAKRRGSGASGLQHHRLRVRLCGVQAPAGGSGAALAEAAPGPRAHRLSVPSSGTGPGGDPPP